MPGSGDMTFAPRNLDLNRFHSHVQLTHELPIRDQVASLFEIGPDFFEVIHCVLELWKHLCECVSLVLERSAGYFGVKPPVLHH